jgi:hypothetical protein
MLTYLMKSYNNTFHRTIGMAPNEVKSQTEDDVAECMNPIKSKLKY